jgi:hypothetical protein
MPNEEIAPRPVPMQMHIEVVEGMVAEEGEPKLKKFVQLNVTTHSGIQVYFLPGEAAEHIGTLMAEKGREAKIGLQVVRGNGAIHKISDNPQA